MKKLVCLVLLAFSPLIYYSCQPEVDIEKEREAIKAVFDAEKDAFFKKDLAGMGDTWIKGPEAVKIYISANSQTKYEGFDKINEQSIKEVSDTTWDRGQFKVAILNYRIDIIGDGAWVLCDYHWEGTLRGEPTIMDQSRICVLKKADGKWKFALMAICRVD